MLKLAHVNTRKRLEFLGGNYGQAFYSILVGTIVFIISTASLDDVMQNITQHLVISVFGVIVANIIIFGFYFLQSRTRLFQEIGVKSHRDLITTTPKLEFSEWYQMRKISVNVFIKNESVYPLKQSVVHVKRVEKLGEDNYKFPNEIRPMRLLDYDEEAGIESNKTVSVSLLSFDGSNLKFTTTPPSPHILEHGVYKIIFVVTSNYWWRKVIEFFWIEVVYSPEGLNWKLNPAT